MKKIVFSLLFLALPCWSAPTYTTRMGIIKPADHDTDWGASYRAGMDVIDSSSCIQNSDNSFTGLNDFDYIRINNSGGKIIFETSTGADGAFLINNTGLGYKTLSIQGIDKGFGIGSNAAFGGFITVEISSSTGGPGGSFAVIGSSANGATTYSGFIATAPIDSSTLWSLPKKDGTSGQALVTDGSAHLSFGSQTTYSAVNGSSVTPSYGFSNSTGTGMYLENTGTITWVTGGVHFMKMLPTGELGIGGSPNTPGNVNEMIHAERSTDGTGNTEAVDIVSDNSGRGSARVIAAANIYNTAGSTSTTSYLIALGSGKPGNWWTGGPSYANSGGIQTQFALSGSIWDVLNSTATYFWNEQPSGVTWQFRHGSTGTLDFQVSDTSVTFKDGTTQTTAGWYVVRSTFSTITSSATNTTGANWFPTNITLSITPKKTTDVVELKFNGLMNESGVAAFCDLNIYAGTGRQILGASGQATINDTSATGTYGPFPLLAYDNPLTTSATTYTVYFRNSGSGGTCTLTPSSYNSVFSALINGN